DPPDKLAYPVQAAWASKLVAPSYGTYDFQLSGANGGNLVIDGTPVFTLTTSTEPSEGKIVLARGVHDVRLTGKLDNATDAVRLEWSAGGGPFAQIKR